MDQGPFKIGSVAWAVAFPLLTAGFLVGYMPKAREAHALSRQKNQMETQLLEEQKRCTQQTDYVRALHSDPVVVRRLLRLKMKWARPDETLYRF